MGQIDVVDERELAAKPQAVADALTEYRDVRGQLWPDMITDYRVVEGGAGAGTRIQYRLHATRKRIRSVDAVIATSESPTGAGTTITESDQNSTMRTVWTVEPNGPDRSLVRVSTSWRGAGGVGGFFERRFAPGGIHRLHRGVLDMLAGRLA
jgi:Polyketide cyclase / dehydrase and lipid transport